MGTYVVKSAGTSSIANHNLILKVLTDNNRQKDVLSTDIRKARLAVRLRAHRRRKQGETGCVRRIRRQGWNDRFFSWTRRK